MARLSAQDVTILVVHDFDKSGFSILHTLRTSTRRHTYETAPKVIDLGLRLADVEAMQLESEAVEYDSKVDPRINLRESGATEEECNFLVCSPTRSGWAGKRVELNAMDSQQFLDWLEGKLQQYTQKVVPSQEALEKTYRRAVRRQLVQQQIEAAIKNLPPDEEIEVPANLSEQVRETITGQPCAWDDAVWDVAEDTRSKTAVSIFAKLSGIVRPPASGDRQESPRD